MSEEVKPRRVSWTKDEVGIHLLVIEDDVPPETSDTDATADGVLNEHVLVDTVLTAGSTRKLGLMAMLIAEEDD